MSWFPSRTWSMAAGAVAFHRCAGVVMTGRRLLSIRFPPGGVNGHHPYRLFTRVITAGLFVPATMWDRPGSGGSGGCRWVG
jgi:hypothetical protein